MNSCHNLNKVTTDTDTETVYQNTTVGGTVRATKSADSDMAVLTLEHRETIMREKANFVAVDEATSAIRKRRAVLANDTVSNMQAKVDLNLSSGATDNKEQCVSAKTPSVKVRTPWKSIRSKKVSLQH